MRGERCLKIRVTPKASSNRIVTGTDDNFDYKVYVTCVPENGKANKAVLALLAKELGVPKSALAIINGELSRDKTIIISKH
ncbi:MAG: DUF167 domain-containing protein [Rhizobiaceae bacterium]